MIYFLCAVKFNARGRVCQCQKIVVASVGEKLYFQVSGGTAASICGTSWSAIMGNR